MQVIEAQRASILEPHDHLHISQMQTFDPSAAMRKDTAGRPTLRGTVTGTRPSAASGNVCPVGGPAQALGKCRVGPRYFVNGLSVAS
jgi:hypothetical protein